MSTLIIKVTYLGFNYNISVPISKINWDTVTCIDASCNNIDNLHWMKPCPNLQTLDISSNNLISLSGLPDKLPNLQKLNISYNKLSSLDGLPEELPNLQHLDLRNNNLSSFEGLPEELPNLEYIYLDNNNLSSLSGLPKKMPNFQRLNLYNNNLSTLEGLPEELPNLQILDISNNKLSSLESLPQELPNLQHLILQNNNLSSLENLPKELQNLESLNINFNNLTSVSGLPKELPNLKTLGLYKNNLSSLEGLPKELPNLKALFISGNNLSSYVGLPKILPNIKVVRIDDFDAITTPRKYTEFIQSLKLIYNCDNLEILHPDNSDNTPKQLPLLSNTESTISTATHLPIQYDLIQNRFHSTNPIIFLGNGNRDFGQRVANYFQPGCISSCQLGRFADGEIKVPNIKENIRQRDCVIIQTCAHSSHGQEGTVNEHYMELLVLVDALKRANARTVTVVLPIYPYQRQDRKPCSRAPITASLIARTLEMLDVTRVITFDLHAGQIQGFFHKTPLDNLYSEPYFIHYIQEIFKKNEQWGTTNDLVVVSPDEGGVKRATRVAKKLGCSMAFLYKDRTAPNEVGDMILMGKVTGRICVMIDDMIDTAGTACKAADILRKNGADTVYLCACHGILSGPAIERIGASCIDRVVVTNTLEVFERFKNSDTNGNTKETLVGRGLSKIDVLDVSKMCACAIERSLTGRSISELMSIE